MTVYGVSYDSVGRQPIVLLRTSDGRRVLPIWIGSGEANAILTKLKGSDPPRPMTHDLLQSLVDLVGASVLRVAVTELRDNTYYAMITLRINGEDVELDSRPSDAIALAVRADAPIFADEAVIEESAVEAERPPSEQQVVEDFRRFLDELSPDDFLRDEYRSSRLVEQARRLAREQRQQAGPQLAQLASLSGPGFSATSASSRRCSRPGSTIG